DRNVTGVQTCALPISLVNYISNLSPNSIITLAQKNAKLRRIGFLDLYLDEESDDRLLEFEPAFAHKFTHICTEMGRLSKFKRLCGHFANVTTIEFQVCPQFAQFFQALAKLKQLFHVHLNVDFRNLPKLPVVPEEGEVIHVEEDEVVLEQGKGSI